MGLHLHLKGSQKILRLSNVRSQMLLLVFLVLLLRALVCHKRQDRSIAENMYHPKPTILSLGDDVCDGLRVAHQVHGP